METKNLSKKQKDKALKTALHNYVWDVVGARRQKNERMFDLNKYKKQDGTLDPSRANEIEVYMDSAEHIKDV